MQFYFTNLSISFCFLSIWFEYLHWGSLFILIIALSYLYNIFYLSYSFISNHLFIFLIIFSLNWAISIALWSLYSFVRFLRLLSSVVYQEKLLHFHNYWNLLLLPQYLSYSLIVARFNLLLDHPRIILIFILVPQSFLTV